MFDELLNPLPSVDNQAPEVIALILDVIPLVQDDSTGSPSLITVDQDAPSLSKSHTTAETQSSVILHDVEEENLDIEVAHTENDPLLGVPISTVISARSSTTVSPHYIVQLDHLIPQHSSKWTKDHSLNNIIDADHAGCQDTHRSTSGSVQFLGERLISWSSKRQKSATISSTKAEYIALAGYCA
nr:retrovirus-related Pol polyprotein from transposon TNT 1-94 [Tanacetum cinerariifolium]